MLKAGTKTRDANAIAAEVEALGGYLRTGADEDSIIVTSTVLTENFAGVMDVLADVVRNSTLPATELEKVRRKRLAELAEAMDDPARLVARMMRQRLFADHPYGHVPPGSTTGIKGLKREDVEAFYRTHLAPANMAVVLVGDLTTDEALQAVKSRLGDWRGGGDIKPLPAATTQPAGVVLVDRPNAPQSQLRVGCLGVPRNHRDYFRLSMLNSILGGQFNSRINMNLREDKGYTYSATSSFDHMRFGGTFEVSTAVHTEATLPAIQEVLKEVELIGKSGVTPQELAGAKNRYSLTLPGYFQSVEMLGDIITNIYLFDLPLDFYQTLPDHIAEVSQDDVLQAAKRYLPPDSLSIVVVGDAARVEASLSTLNRGTVAKLTPSP
jgi:zinc protease